MRIHKSKTSVAPIADRYINLGNIPSDELCQKLSDGIVAEYLGITNASWLQDYVLTKNKSDSDKRTRENDNNIKGVWLENAEKGKSVDSGSDISVSLRRIANERSYLASHALHIDLLGVGVSFSKSRTANGIDVDFYIGDSSTEARAKKHKLATIFLPLLIGYKAAALLFGTLVAISGILLKSLLAAKTALLITGSVALKKLFSSSHGEHHQIHLYPKYDDIHTSSSEHHPTVVQPYHGGLHPYHREDIPYEMQESHVSPIYVAAAPSTASLTASASNGNLSSQANDIKRKFVKKKQQLKPMYTIKMTNN